MIGNCLFVPCEDGYCCELCGAGPYDSSDARRNCGKAKPPTHTCGQPLVRKKRLPEGKVWWRCEACHAWDRECKTCNAKLSAAQLESLASEHDAVD